MGSAIGAEKTAAKRVGISLEDYRAHVAAGEKRCTDCKEWKPIGHFVTDSSRADGLAAACAPCARARRSAAYTPRPRPAPGRRFAAARDGDRLQARGRVAHLVRVGLLADPNTLPCTDCGHVGGQADAIRHEYDHHLGYEAEHHEHVQAVCTRCHHARETSRGVTKRRRGARGRFVGGA